MLRFRLALPVILAGLVSLMTCVSVYADDTLEIITPVPAPKDSAIPPGYIGCFDVKSGWYKGVWYPGHRVCQYDPSRGHAAEGDAYVAGHWACDKYMTAEHLKGECTNWDWKPGHWIKTFPVY